MRDKLKERIRKFNETTRKLEKSGFRTHWNEKAGKTEVYIPGNASTFPKIIGYISKFGEFERI